MIRIISGQFKGIRLATPPLSQVRPTRDFVKEALFNILRHKLRLDFEGLRVVDVCAGTGSLGIEALSLGAQEVVFIEHPYAEVVQSNIAKIGCAERSHIIARPLQQIQSLTPFDLAFFDPPYRDTALIEKGLDLLKAAATENSIVCLESAKDFDLTRQDVALIDKRIYGNSALFIICMTSLIK